MKNRVAVVTGGSKGIGFAVARRFAESGARVAMLARGAADLKAARERLAKDGIEVRDYVCDVSKAGDIAKIHDKVTADLGPVDVLVNNAGTSRAMAFETVTDEIWQEDLDLKLFAAIRFSRLVWPGMKARKWGEGGAHNILVNAMLVGLIVSDQWVKRHAQRAPDSDFDAFTRDLAKGVPLGRMGTAEEFANLACFLASEQGSYITGTAINVDGGRSPVV
jgi:NAD(P)-dependent dehydrogenase (short-subunit alcohol dehydrogenase family)